MSHVHRMGKGGPNCLRVQKRSDADQEKSLDPSRCSHGDRLKEPITWAHARSVRVRAHLEMIGTARKAFKMAGIKDT